jgi:hypothetical protein
VKDKKDFFVFASLHDNKYRNMTFMSNGYSLLPKRGKLMRNACFIILALLLLGACTQETQNKFGRAVQNWTGTNGVLEVYAGDKLVKRFLKIDKLTTASATDGKQERPYRFGYGVFDENLNGMTDANEKRVYFEFSDYSTSYIFYENPR